ncbi:MAG: Flp family type IVb pilin [Alphaproteobacteria bacterium]|nr:Flp family type IVb pilin [Alphaproteobacteria bacterium]
MFHSLRAFAERTVARLHSAVIDREGATAIEYGLLAALIAVVIITAVSSVGTNLGTTFNAVANKLT